MIDIIIDCYDIVAEIIETEYTPTGRFLSKIPQINTIFLESVILPLGLALGSPIFPSGCEGKLGVALDSLQGLRDLT